MRWGIVVGGRPILEDLPRDCGSPLIALVTDRLLSLSLSPPRNGIEDGSGNENDRVHYLFNDCQRIRRQWYG